MNREDVKLKISVCPECKNAIRVCVAHTMDEESKKDFLDEVFQNDLQVKTMTIKQYEDSNIQICHDINCKNK